MAYGAPTLVGPGERAIEDGFPFEHLSDIAEVESWRKEVWRPVYHVHKWWAKRLGSVFRAAVLGACVPRGSAIMDLFYNPVKLPSPVIFDPFMGSGTTVGEAHKLGCTAIGRDINPVAHRSVRVSLSPLSRANVLEAFDRVREAVEGRLLAMHRSTDSGGKRCDVLYWFWVKHLPCPDCHERVDLFSTRVFAKHAYVKKYPRVHVCCPDCDEVFACQFTDKTARCPTCEAEFDPHDGPANGSKATCSSCNTTFPIAKRAQQVGAPPPHRLYAKLVLTSTGKKEYLRITADDLALFASAERELAQRGGAGVPEVAIRAGHNTRQVLNYGYTRWDEFFNARQLLGISLLADAIRERALGPEREALLLLLSGVLEFNNLFASYKGEGTGAVRHMFSHHVLKPQRTPIEANLWGTPKSSGSFSTLFERRVLKAISYKAAPFEARVRRNTKGKKSGDKVFALSPPMGRVIRDQWPPGGLPPGSIYVSCGDSARTDIPDSSVDAVVTDPPFFDNVHYSELADFFHVWQALWFDDETAALTTRSAAEVQDTDSASFARKLGDVFRECNRVLKSNGLLVFSYHHSREDGWSSVADAVVDAGFSFVQAQPVKAEMSVASPKLAAKSPIDLDVMLVCRKRAQDGRAALDASDAVIRAGEVAEAKVARFNATGRELSHNDVRVVLFSQLLVELSAGREPEQLRDLLGPAIGDAGGIAEALWREQAVVKPEKRQRDLFPTQPTTPGERRATSP